MCEIEDFRSISFMKGFRCSVDEKKNYHLSNIHNDKVVVLRLPELVIIQGISLKHSRCNKERYCLINKTSIDNIILYLKLLKLKDSFLEDQLYENLDIWSKELFGFFKRFEKGEKEEYLEKYKNKIKIIKMFYR